MATKLDLRQSVLRAALGMVGSAANDSADTILPKIDAELAKLFEDRNIMLSDGGLLTFTGTTVQFTESLKLTLNQKISGAAPQVIDLGSTTRSISASGRMIYAVIDRTAGTAVVTADATTLPAAASANQEVFLIAKRIDAADGTKRLYFRNGAAFDEGQTARLGSAGSGSGSGLGDDINSLKYRASFNDPFDDKKAVNSTAGFTDDTLYSAGKKLYRLSYDASKTVTGTGTAMTISGAPSFTIKAGDMIVIGTEARRISAISSQTLVTIEAAFSTNPSASAACISQAVHTVDVTAYDDTATTESLQTAFGSASLSSYMITYRDSAALDDNWNDDNATPSCAFVVSTDNTTWSAPGTRPNALISDNFERSTASTGTSFYLRFFANKTSGTGAVNILDYKVFLYKETITSSGTASLRALARTDGAGTATNCSVSSATGKTRITTTFTLGTEIGLFLDGKRLPEFVDTTLTPDGYFKRISGTVVELDSDYSGAGLQVEIVTASNTIDNTEVNSSAITAVQNFASSAFQGFVDESARLTAVNGTPTSGQFRSSVVGRASIPDLANDLRARMGIDRIMVQQIVEVQNEFGTAGERVFKALNDDRDLIRFVGNWGTAVGIGPSGQLNYGSTVGDYVEVTFYGTGLNVLSFAYSDSRNFQASVDGGSLGGNILPGSTANTVLYGRGYSINQAFPVASGLALGLHTVKIQVTATTPSIYGFEILNEASTINVRPGTAYVGSKKLASSLASSLAYNSSFDSILRDGASVGSLSTRGARALAYLKSDGTIGKSAIEVDSTQRNLTSADHSNEEVARVYNFREFGAGRSDDFSTLTTGVLSGAAFTLDDGITTLVGNHVQTLGSTLEGVCCFFSSNNGFLTVTFVGTGLDIKIATDSVSRSFTAIYVDGGSTIGTISKTANSAPETKKICSGLPYGTHTVKFENTSGTSSPVINQFIVYGPKKPALPAGSVELADYNVMATYVAAAGTQTGDTISTGAIRKLATREITYVGTWSGGAILGNVPDPGGWLIRSSTNGDYFQYTFFGTGIEVLARATSSTISMTVAIDGSNYIGAATALAGTGGAGGNSWTAGTSTWVADAGTGTRLQISGLALGLHTIKVTAASVGNLLNVNGFDVITPIYSHRSNLYGDLQNVLPVGSCAISDNRKISAIKEILPAQKAWAQAVGVVSAPTTSSTTAVPFTDLSLTMKTTGGPLEIYAQANVSNGTVNGSVFLQIFVDGIAYGIPGQLQAQVNGGYNNNITASAIVPVSAGTHKVDAYWWQTGGNGATNSTQRMIKAREL